MHSRRALSACALLWLTACGDAAADDDAAEPAAPHEESPARTFGTPIVGAVSATVSYGSQADGESYFFESATTADTFESQGASCFSGYAGTMVQDDVRVQATGPAGTLDLSARFGSGSLAQEGEVITFSADGSAKVPAFVGYVRVPSKVQVTAPTWLIDDGEEAHLPFGDLTIEWSADDDDDDVTVVASSQGAAAGSRVQCVVPARRGSLTIDAIRLAGLRRRSNVVVSVTSSRSRGVEVDGRTIAVEAQTLGKLRFFDDAP